MTDEKLNLLAKRVLCTVSAGIAVQAAANGTASAETIVSPQAVNSESGSDSDVSKLKYSGIEKYTQQEHAAPVQQKQEIEQNEKLIDIDDVQSFNEFSHNRNLFGSQQSSNEQPSSIEKQNAAETIDEPRDAMAFKNDAVSMEQKNDSVFEPSKADISKSTITPTDDIDKVFISNPPMASQNKQSDIQQNDNEQDLNMLQKLNSRAPQWTHDIFQQLLDKGMISPYNGSNLNINSMTRREAAVYTSMAYYSYEQLYGQRVLKTEMAKERYMHDDIDKLMREFAAEIESMGYDMRADAADPKVKNRTDYDWDLGGEVKYNYAHNYGAPRFDWDDSRLRTRVYGEKHISDDWSIFGMLQSDKSFLRDNSDGKVELKRLFLKGNFLWKNRPVYTELGRTTAFLAEGNVLDADFEGAKVAVDFDPPPGSQTKLMTGWGRVDDSQNHLLYSELWHKKDNYNLMGGWYRYSNYGRPSNIFAMGMDYYTGNYTLGAMAFHTSLNDGHGNKNGYVLSARYGQNFSWVKDTWEVDLKYYDMPKYTYISHTMSGLAGYMDGFKGWGAMAYYTIMKDTALGIEYYDLKDKVSGERGKTTWLELIYSWD